MLIPLCCDNISVLSYRGDFLFGYVKPDKAELKIKEYETYKAIYCSLCKTLGKEYGVFSRFFLTYDATFFAIFLKSVFQNRPDCAEKGVCRFNPLKKCYYIDEDGILKKAAALTIIMFFYKLMDNMKDASFYKKAVSRLIFPYVKLKFKKAVKNYSQYNDIIELQMKRQEQIEKENTDSVDRACDPSAKALAEIFTLDMEQSEQKETAARTAYCIGRWVYLMDAFDDLEKDIKTNSYNPFINLYLLTDKKTDNLKSVYKQIIGRIRITANEAADSFDKLNKQCYNSILENIIFDGMENELINLINKKKKRGENVGE